MVQEWNEQEFDGAIGQDARTETGLDRANLMAGMITPNIRHFGCGRDLT